MLILALALAAPTPFTEIHQRDIGCVATIAIMAGEQRKGGWTDHDEMSRSGKRWAGVVGDRVVSETGQPREVVALAMSEAAKAERARADDIEIRKDRIADCRALMMVELYNLDAAKTALPVPVKP